MITVGFLLARHKRITWVALFKIVKISQLVFKIGKIFEMLALEKAPGSLFASWMSQVPTTLLKIGTHLDSKMISGWVQ